jgi:pimeloyl-ACP methyl ester carboxylesterase
MVLLVAFLASAGAIYQVIATYRDARRYPPPGKLVDVGGHRLHLWCMGEGSPTVVLDSGVGGFSLSWRRVQLAVAEFTSVCSYDRAGFGWSEPGPMPRTSEQIVRESHNLLRNGGLKGPYVLVGHSFGGFNVRLYANQYPDEVAGVVLIDSSHPDQDDRPEWEKKKDAARALRNGRFYSILAQLGIIRLYVSLAEKGYSVGEPGKELQSRVRELPSDVRPMFLAVWRTPKGIEAMASEWAFFFESAAQVHATGKLGDIPLVVLTRGRDLNPSWMKVQNDLASLSSNSQHIIASNSGHGIPQDQPELVIDAIRHVVEAVRKHPLGAKH